MHFDTHYNAMMNQLSALSPFYLNQLHNYQPKNYEQDSLIHRQVLNEPEVKFGEDTSDNPETGTLLPDKTKSLKTLVDTINLEIDGRSAMQQGIMEKIEYDMMKCSNYLLEIKSFATRYHPNVGKRRTSIEHDILNLEREKRMEETACWRDLIFLKKDLFATLKEYWDAVNREKLLSETNFE